MPESNTIKRCSSSETNSSPREPRPESNSKTLKIELRKSEVPPKQRLPTPVVKRSE